MANFIHISLANGTNSMLKIVTPSKNASLAYSLKTFPYQMTHFIHVSLANGTPLICFPIKWPTLSILPLQIVRLKKFPCQMDHFIDVSIANGTL